MESKELRLGNLVSFDGRIATVYQVNRTGAVLQYEGDTNTEIDGIRRSTVSINDIQPIKITEDILVRVGFHRNKSIVRRFYEIKTKDSIVYEVLMAEYGLYFYISTNSIWVTSLHQLQNLYFAITGKELEAI